MRIPLQTDPNRLLSLLFVVQVVEAVLAVAVLAKLAIRKTIAIQFQALRLGAIAVLASRTIQIRFGGRRVRLLVATGAYRHFRTSPIRGATGAARAVVRHDVRSPSVFQLAAERIAQAATAFDRRECGPICSRIVILLDFDGTIQQLRTGRTGYCECGGGRSGFVDCLEFS